MLLFLSADSPEPKGRKAVVMLTLRKLKEMVESPKKGEKKPSCKSLREGKYPVVAQKIIKNEVGKQFMDCTPVMILFIRTELPV